jgi:hypothetical protein
MLVYMLISNVMTMVSAKVSSEAGKVLAES